MDEADHAKVLETQHRERSINAALNRPKEAQIFDDKGNVICKDCRERLSKARLKANPQAARCVDCQTNYEKKGRYARWVK